MTLTAPHRVLVTGANGFVGRTLCEVMQQDEMFEVVAALRSVASPEFGSTQVVVGNIDGNTEWRAALAGVHTVVHLAARVHVMHESSSNPLAEFQRVNVEGTRALATQAAAAGVNRLVFLSSVKVHGESGRFTESDVPHPVDPYGTSKLEAEQVLHEIAATTGLQVVIVRPPLMYGPGVKANFRELFNLVKRGIPLPLASVQNQRSFLAVQNLAHFIVQCTVHPHAANETFLVSDGNDLSTPELIRHMARALGTPARLVRVPVWLLKTAAAATGQRASAARLLESLQLDISKARERLGWTPPLTVDQALRLLVEL